MLAAFLLMNRKASSLPLQSYAEKKRSVANTWRRRTCPGRNQPLPCEAIRFGKLQQGKFPI
jgi:hypothetical protein